MIRLTKLPLPAEIAERIAARTTQYLHLLSNDLPIPTALEGSYKDKDVKELLRSETADKCAYCESKVAHIDYGDVEHIISKAARPELRFDYANLTFSCGICNNRKGGYHSLQLPLINPFVDDPADHLMAIGPMVMRTPNSDRGQITQRRLGLNRPELMERRSEHLEQLASLVDQLARTESAEIRAVLKNEIELECGPDKEYAFVKSAYVREALSHL